MANSPSVGLGTFVMGGVSTNYFVDVNENFRNQSRDYNLSPMAQVPELDRSNQRNAVMAGFLGWMLDAFDFFIVTLVINDLAKAFGQTRTSIAFASSMTLMMRPVGAIIFGVMADRFGRKLPLMLNVIMYASVSVA